MRSGRRLYTRQLCSGDMGGNSHYDGIVLLYLNEAIGETERRGTSILKVDLAQPGVGREGNLTTFEVS